MYVISLLFIYYKVNKYLRTKWDLMHINFRKNLVIKRIIIHTFFFYIKVSKQCFFLQFNPLFVTNNVTYI